MIQSSNFQTGVSGFRMKADGELEANNGIFRGHIEAESGTFKGHIEADSGTFRDGVFTDITVIGNSELNVLAIKAGPLQVIPEGNKYDFSYNAGSSIEAIIKDIAARTGQSSTKFNISVTTGSYGGAAGKTIASLSGFSDWWTVSYGPDIYIHTIVALYTDGSTQYIMDAATNNLPYSLSFSFDYGDITFKLINLPAFDPHKTGVVWRDGTTLKISNG